MAKAELTYEKAYIELQKIVEEIESENVSLDNLSAKIKRAAELLNFCQTKLKSTEEEFIKFNL